MTHHGRARNCQTTDVALVSGTKAKNPPRRTSQAPIDGASGRAGDDAAGDRKSTASPYSYGGGHGATAQTMSQTLPTRPPHPATRRNGRPGYDCSSATDYVLYGGGLGESLLADQTPASPRSRASASLAPAVG